MERATANTTIAVNNYQSNTKKSFEMAGQNIETYGVKVEGKFEDIVNKSHEVADTVEDMGEEMVDTMANIQSET